MIPDQSLFSVVADDEAYYTKFPSALMPSNPSAEAVLADFEKNMDPTLASDAVPFVDQLVSHTIHGLPAAMIKQVLSHKVNDKYLTLSGGGDFKKKSFEGPKRSKFRKQMSSRQRKANGFDELSKEHEKYELYVPLHELWKQYMVTLTTGTKSDKGFRFARADWHGAIIQVVKSCNPGLVGTTGIILEETTNTFKVITAEDKYKTLPKPNTVFTIKVNDSTLATLYGNHILYKSGDRSVRKYKSKQTIDIGV
jgi:RNase P/RNase MRP subunit p29